MKIIGTVTEIVYYNSVNGYAVCDIETEDDTITAVGYMPYIAGGDKVTLTGTWTFHQDYGPQFKVDFFEKNMPTEINDILTYLSSGSIKGVRAATAQKIVDMFGEDTLTVLEKEPEKLAKIHGISRKKALEIGEEYVKQQGVRNIVMYLQKFGITPQSAVKVYKRYGSGSVEIIKENPYVLSETVYNIGFKTADKIALEMGILPNAPIRIEGAVKHILTNASMNGHTYVPKDVLLDELCNFLSVSSEEAENVIVKMIFESKLKNENYNNGNQKIYLPKLFEAEVYVAHKIKKISENNTVEKDIDIEKVIEEIEKTSHITLAEHQKSAIYCAMEKGATVITGGPGTGKTTIINTIIQIMDKLDKTVMLAAPTGRAAMRMTEVCGIEAKTIHRLLESSFSESEDHMNFAKNEDNPLDCDIIIIDEMSMVDILLIQSLLKALRPHTKLIMVGDSDQLPSVGAGNVLRDIINSGVVPTVSLTEIFRQAKESAIIVNAHKINGGEYPEFNKEGTDFFIVKRDTAVDISQSIIDLFINRLPKAYKYNPLYQIQILSPTRKGITGVNELNVALQKVINPPDKKKKEKAFKNIIFREGDKVMQTRNNYDMEWTKLDSPEETGFGIFNGDIGYIHRIDKDMESATIVFDDRLCIYEFAKLEDLDLAYAVTVHKSQGSEFDVVIMPMYPCAPMLQNRNLFYTAVTRAKKLVVLVGRESCVQKMVENKSEQIRYTGLEQKLRNE
ncbi:MAG: ATP-dependent RecD-like DNA helicase [Clostridia bacterium]|nr:ATP-dependent RecD-like DNA helicase [Clostridia bacterium]